jgi:hypothetical protein
MANVLYRKLPNGDWLNQANPGGPNYFQVQNDSDGLYYPFFTYDGGEKYLRFTPAGGGFATVATAQAALDAYVGQLNAGTA